MNMTGARPTERRSTDLLDPPFPDPADKANLLPSILHLTFISRLAPRADGQTGRDDRAGVQRDGAAEQNYPGRCQTLCLEAGRGRRFALSVEEGFRVCSVSEKSLIALLC